MALADLAALSRHDRVRLAVLLAAVVVAVVWASAQFLQPVPPRRLVLASGTEGGLYHQYALRYREILGRAGVTVDERTTGGARANLALLLDPRSSVDVAFVQGGLATFPEAHGLVMLASLYYEPCGFSIATRPRLVTWASYAANGSPSEFRAAARAHSWRSCSRPTA